MNLKELGQYLLSKDSVYKEYPFEKNIAVYKIGTKESNQMMALVKENSNPIKISLRCDSQLARLLRAKYESVMPGEKLDKDCWNTIIMSGQLRDQEILDLIEHSYQQTLKLMN